MYRNDVTEMSPDRMGQIETAQTETAQTKTARPKSCSVLLDRPTALEGSKICCHSRHPEQGTPSTYDQWRN